MEYVVEPGDVAFDATPAELHRRLRRIFDNARTSVEERGVTTLHLSFGLLCWEDPQLGESVSPLWLVPCTLENFGPSAAMRLSRADEEAQLNPALALYLRERQHVRLPEAPEEPTAESLATVLEEVRDAVREQGWKVENDMWLSTYSFESLVLYKDLRALESVALGNPIVAALARAIPLPERSEALGEEALDTLPTPNRVPEPVLPADSSQLAALLLARDGKHLVVHGPPGTGKSQTITNLIADALGRGLKVLFVSAKMAALDVVHERLAKLGLARFCLEAHSTKAGKARVIEELRRTLATAVDAAGSDDLEEHLQDLLRIREELNTYVSELHTRRTPLGLSVYQAVGRAERLRSEADVRAPLLWPDPLGVSRGELNAALEAVRDLAAQAEVFDGRASHPWRGLAVRTGAPTRREAIEADLRTVRDVIARVEHDLAALSPLLGASGETISLDVISALAEVMAEISRLGRMPAAWGERTTEDLRAAAEQFEEASRLATELRTKQAEHVSLVKLPVDDAVQNLAVIDTEFARWTRVLDPGYWRWRASIRLHLADPSSCGFSRLRTCLALARRVQELTHWFEARRDALGREVGQHACTDPNELKNGAQTLRVAARLQDALSRAGLPRPDGSPPLSEEIHRASDSLVRTIGAPALGQAVARINAAWTAGFVDGHSLGAAPLSAARRRAEQVLAEPSRLQEWLVLQHTLARCATLGLGAFVGALETLSARDAPGAFERLFYMSWAAAVLEASPALAAFAGLRHEERIRQFRELDVRVRQAARARIMEEAARPAGRVATAKGGVGSPSEVGILRRELQRQRGFKPLRKLFAEIPNVLQALKPCMLMSPLSVSTFLAHGGLTFDLVVFDEASQLPSQEAIPAILRARQVVVAGDAKQLPPTSFFAASVIFDESREAREAEDFEPLESLLDDCVALVPVLEEGHLRWHYRSRDERLIRFSNHYFYRERPLITFPSSMHGPETGVRLEYVADGEWDRGGSRTNRAEARRVAGLIVEHLERHPDRSLGVVAMNVTQREAIEEALEERLLERRDLLPLIRDREREPFFVKALENVQGDERDSIMISVGYARGPGGGLTYNFGPLNQENGWRRLNVLVTRGRLQTILVTSLRARDLAGVNPDNRGAVALRNYIEYAERGGELPAAEVVPTGAESNDFEDEVAEVLRAHGFSVDQQVGASGYRVDLAIRDPRIPYRYVLGIECDGATYHSARTARDRDLVRQEVLREQGWRLYRVWSTDWFRDRDRAVLRLFAATEQALREPPETSVPSAPTSPPTQRKVDRAASPPSGDAPVRSGAAPGPRESAPPPSTTRSESGPAAARRYRPGQPYRRYREPGARDLLLDSDRVQRLAEQVARVVEAEGPVHTDLLVERLKEINGVARAGANVQANIDRAVATAMRRGRIERVTRDFVKAPGTRLETFRTAGDGVDRPLAQVSPEEIELAVLYLIEDQWGYQREAIPPAVAELLGFDRRPVGAADTIGRVVDLLIERGALKVSGPNVYVA